MIRTLLIAFLLPSSCLSFLGTTHHHRSRTTNLNLTPSQGKELEAFVNKQCTKNSKSIHVEMDTRQQETTTTTTAPAVTPLTAARSFLTRIFHQDDESLVYPIVGFRWVGNNVIPTTTTAACVIHREELNEELYGWFTPVSKEMEDDEK
mmetsp:Transcript_14855/g.21708  ORF Transcript_14855/g.21708 Transcript_14855/m.21708 type:complete len:149 (-) Transcript_14855:277-723(-)